jgi:hypothetical protein
MSPTELEKFKEETHQACVLAGEKLLNWLVRQEKKDKGIISDSEWRESNNNCYCPLLARQHLTSFDNEVLSGDEYWSFAQGFDGNNPPKNLFSEEFFLLGREFRRKVLDGVYHPPRSR